MPAQKRVAAVHDISCFGKCSLTVALPVISAAGIEVSIVPTAVLSTHTGGFTGYTYRDLTDDILPIISHWQSLGLRFDAVYTGYLGSFRQLDIVEEMIERLKTPELLTVVDPVMADEGALYKGFADDFPSGMKKLCRKASIIVPNMTEACLLLGQPYRPEPYDKAFIESVLKGLADLGPERIVLTGVCFDGDRLGAACFDARTNRIDYALSGRVSGVFHGTGDLFASALIAGLLKGRSLSDAAGLAVDFTYQSILRTKAAGTDVRFGVNFEEGLADFAAGLR